MTGTPPCDVTAVEAAAALLTAERPAYASIIGFYGAVFVAQARMVGTVSPETIQLDESLVETKVNQGFSLIEPAAFTVDTPMAENLLIRICDIAVHSGEKLGLAGEALMGSIDGGLDMDGLFADILDNQGRIRELADTLDVPQEVLSLLFYLAIKPSLEIGARMLSDHLTDSQKNRSSCPICGSAPIIGELDAEGSQWLHCGLCWHRWPFVRLACPFCTRDKDRPQEYIYTESEPEYRVNLCSGCRHYLKVVDTRHLTRTFCPPLEQVASLHLDMLATQKGYSHPLGAGSPMQ
ncbi:MAG: formate dehydrogenase accessory protein FdhE [Desulfosarcina sp.]|jgi:FdhE protein